MKWWEKTVEYYFIRKFIPDEMILSPLDGEQEKAGDAFLSSSEKWVVLEFKKDLKSLATEKKKYKNYDLAAAELSSSDSHHFLIYGQIAKGKFGLGGKTYFSNSPVSKISEIFEAGKEKEEFISYLERLIEHKSKVDESSGGSVGSYSFVAGINKDNKVTSCMNLYEFGLDHGLKLEPKPEIKREVEHERSGPSLRM
ncbi:hypothetical protein EXT46_05155 [Pseudoalteromonas sp. CO325X]|uniref:hypothetical protein n=1 Tax=Pseudoalteromonas sp. CO325X TaxID=1777262 RepID=UPI0010232823|nr:hypothetical protein [Pseudoalteromonas sp. CO325X]RZF83684.1 hypothetical protein EXT46_05155 [Pseudoalteromonas sp. CO325X]